MDLATSEISGDELKLEEDALSEHETDLPPEYCHYRDEGCEFAGSCLGCPFPQCLYDEPRGKQHWMKASRNKEIARLFSGGGWGVGELALLFGLSRRTIQRALKSTLSMPSLRQGIEPVARQKTDKGERNGNE